MIIKLMEIHGIVPLIGSECLFHRIFYCSGDSHIKTTVHMQIYKLPIKQLNNDIYTLSRCLTAEV